MLSNWEIMSYGKRFIQVACALLIALCAVPLFADDKLVMGVVSIANKNSDSIFDEIIDGIRSDFDGSVKVYKLKKGFSEKALLEDLEKDGVDIVTTLGHPSQNVASLLSSYYPVQVGAVPFVVHEGIGGVTYMPSCKIIIDRLRTLAPDIDNLDLVYKPGTHDEAISRVEVTAEQYGINVTARASSNTKETHAAIEDALGSARNGTNSPRNALWVMFKTAFSKSNIEHLIKESWNRPVVPFYYTPSHKHVDRFPFIFLPDWKGMGAQLAEMGEARLSGANAEVLPLESIKLWVNQKKSHHYGLNLDSESRKMIDNIFKGN